MNNRTPDLLCEQVKDVEYAWKEKGKAFTVNVKGMQKHTTENSFLSSAPTANSNCGIDLIFNQCFAVD
jgi:hypothetical protein